MPRVFPEFIAAAGPSPEPRSLTRRLYMEIETRPDLPDGPIRFKVRVLRRSGRSGRLYADQPLDAFKQTKYRHR